MSTFHGQQTQPLSGHKVILSNYIPKPKKHSPRHLAILQLYKDVHKIDVITKEDEFIINLLDRLKDIYDNNYNVLKKYGGTDSEKKLKKETKRKEQIFYNISVLLRKWLKIHLNDHMVGDHDGKHGRYYGGDRLPVGSGGPCKPRSKGLLQGTKK